MMKVLLSSLLVVCLFVEVAVSQYWPTQQQTQTCITTGGLCERYNILLQCCPGLVCGETIIPGVKTMFTEYRCKADLYIPGQWSGGLMMRGQQRNEDE